MSELQGCWIALKTCHLDQVPQSKKPQLSTITSVNTPKRVHHKWIIALIYGTVAKLDPDHCCSHHYHILTNKMTKLGCSIKQEHDVREWNGECFRRESIAASKKAREMSELRKGDLTSTDTKQWRDGSKMIKNYKYRIREYSIIFNTGKSQVGRWYSRQSEQPHCRMKMKEIEKNNAKPSKMNPKPTQHCICSQVLFLTRNCAMLIPTVKYEWGSLLHITLMDVLPSQTT